MATATATARARDQGACVGGLSQHYCDEGCPWIEEPISYEMTARIVRVSREIALRWLRRNDKNRTFSRVNARILADEMGHGYWRENGESIVFDFMGILIDGQHPLQAVVDTGHEYLVPVVTGVPLEARPTVDTGLKRSAANNFGMAGEIHTSCLAATISLWRGYKTREVREMTHQSRRLSVSGAMEFLEKWPQIREAAKAAVKLRPGSPGRMLMPVSEVAMVWLAIVDSGAAKDRANEYLGMVLSGHNLAPGNPVLALRRRLDEHMRPGHRMHKLDRLALVLRAWQLWSTGKTRQVLRWEHDQPFPFLD